MIRVVLADDHPVVTDGLKRFFTLAPDVEIVSAVGSFQDLRRRIPIDDPDVVVVDLNMPGMKGASSVRALTSRGQRPAVVVFTMQDEDHYAVSLMKAGAKAYLSKSRPPEELADAIRLASRGARYLTESVSTRLLTAAESGTTGHDSFSAREREVFDAIVGGAAAKKIAADLGISVSTVHTYTERIKTKLDVESLSEVVSYAFRHSLAR